MAEVEGAEADNTAIRVALWRAQHVEVDAAPHVLDDTVGLELAAPPGDWRKRGDMHPGRIRRNRAAIVARGRFIDDLVTELAGQGIGQYVILGAGLDSFAQRRPDVASKLRIFEIDQPVTQAWKRRRLQETGYGIPDWLRLVPVDFEAGESWLDAIAAAGFDRAHPAVVASTGVSMYISKAATLATLREIAGLAPGTTLAMSFMPPIELVDPEEHPALRGAAKGAAARGTPFVSFYTPAEAIGLAQQAGFKTVRHVSAGELAELYFAGRTDGLKPSTGEEMIVATV